MLYKQPDGQIWLIFDGIHPAYLQGVTYQK